jgi:hypothetical protein
MTPTIPRTKPWLKYAPANAERDRYNLWLIAGNQMHSDAWLIRQQLANSAVEQLTGTLHSMRRLHVKTMRLVRTLANKAADAGADTRALQAEIDRLRKARHK